MLLWWWPPVVKGLFKFPLKPVPNPGKNNRHFWGYILLHAFTVFRFLKYFLQINVSKLKELFAPWSWILQIPWPLCWMAPAVCVTLSCLFHNVLFFPSASLTWLCQTLHWCCGPLSQPFSSVSFSSSFSHWRYVGEIYSAVVQFNHVPSDSLCPFLREKQRSEICFAVYFLHLHQLDVEGAAL